MAEDLLPAPCEKMHAVSHHLWVHPIGRIRRHGTRRIARRLHKPPGGCLPGPAAALKLIVPAASIVAGVAAASTHAVRTGLWEAGIPNDPGAAFGGFPGGTVSIGRHGHHHIVTVPEPPSLVVLLSILLVWTGLRRLLKPARIRRT